jgi:LysM repeat protein
MQKKWLTIALMITTLVILLGVVPASAAPDESGIVHVVQYGETLYSIARRYGVNVWTIANANRITNPNRIYVGQRLVIPSGRPAGTIHVVQPGEALLQIALRYGVDAWTIAHANGITNLNHIYIGQRLVIPKAAPPAPRPSPQPSLPSSWPGPWSAEYFDNITLTAPAYATRDDESINFDWGWGPPAGGMPTNSFSVRWKGTFHFDEGTYRFYTKVDDAVRVYVDDEVIIDSWRDGGFRLYTKDRDLTSGDHTIQVEYYDRTQVARIYFWWKFVSGPTPTATPASDATATPAPSDDGWWGEFYNNEDLEGDPVVTQHTPRIEFDWGTESPAPGVWQDGFSVRWTSKIHLKTDHYRFCVMSDDGVRIWIGEDLVLDEWRANNGVEPMCANYWVETGTYDAQVEYYEHGGDALIYVWWEPH